MMQQTRSSDGTLIGFLRSGSGTPLLLVHGTTADHSRWAAIAPRFEQYFSVCMMDRRGRGGSTDSDEYDLMREAEDVAAVVEAIGEPLYVLGHSYGAVCCLEAALLTDNMRRMILYEPPIPTGLPMYPPDAPQRMQTLIDNGDLETALELFMREIVQMPDDNLAVYRQSPAWQVRVQLAPTIPRELAIDRTYSFDRSKFAKLHLPTRLLLGGDSPPLFRQATQTVATALVNSAVVTLTGQQHIAMDTNPDLFVDEVLQFLQD